MTKEAFNDFAREILLREISVHGNVNPDRQAREAVRTADRFLKALTARHERLNKLSGKLTTEEISFIQNQKVISAIKAVRERLGINLKDAKALVDSERFRLGL